MMGPGHGSEGESPSFIEDAISQAMVVSILAMDFLLSHAPVLTFKDFPASGSRWGLDLCILVWYECYV